MLDAVVPLVGKDLARFRILERSIAVHLLPLQTCWVVVPDREYRELAEAIPGRRFAVVPESHIVPELAAARGVKGWYKQQLIKLAMAEHVETDYYLVFDADVICARPITKGDLFVDGKAICHRFPGKTHANWYRWAERVLGVRRSGWVHGVTPTVLASRAVLEMARFVDRLQPRPPRWWQGILPRSLSGPRQTGLMLPELNRDTENLLHWREILLKSLPWTEYGLYFTFLEAAGLFEQFHFHSSESLCGTCVWRSKSFATWNPVDDVNRRQRPFLLVQSIANIPPELVLEKVEKLLAA